ncbi:MAG: PspC domain-containing protein [Alistipes sp.]|nr:PspC domain-containing protein [Alistipes sp.]MDE6711839.1 PspC domain-containing protein [Alistipes sp.]
MANAKRLYRTRDGIVAGVCGGVADYFGLDRSLIRIATAILILFGGLSLWVYIILWIIMPKAPGQLNA